MSVVEELKARLSDVPGIQNLTMQSLAGMDRYCFDGLIVSVPPLASQSEIETAIRNAARLPAVTMPTVQPMPKPQTTGKAMSVTGALYAGGSLKDQLASIKAKIAQGQGKMSAAIEKMNQAAEAHNQLADTVSSEADSLLADIGQFTNSMGESGAA